MALQDRRHEKEKEQTVHIHVNSVLFSWAVCLGVLYKKRLNKVVVGSSCGDVPKYTGQGVALHGTPGVMAAFLGPLWPF